MKRIWVTIFFALVVVLWFIVGDKHGFDSTLWKAQYNSHDERDDPRIYMVSDLEQNILKKGMSKKEVRVLLGPPDQEERHEDVYNLGVFPYGIDYDVYVITYDHNNKVIKFFIRRG